MATIDPRLLPLIEALAAVDADWLAFEILEGLRQGRVAEETRDDLERTRRAVRSARRQPTPESQQMERPRMPIPLAEPILGDQQIDWAADYVGGRISEVVFMLETALDQLDGIISHESTREGSLSSEDREQGITLVLQADDAETSVSSDEVVHARAALTKLKDALFAWAASTRKRGITE